MMLEVPKVFQVMHKMQVELAVTIASLSQVKSFTLSEQAEAPSIILFHCFFRTVSYYLLAAFYTFYSKKKKKAC